MGGKMRKMWDIPRFWSIIDPTILIEKEVPYSFHARLCSTGIDDSVFHILLERGNTFQLTSKVFLHRCLGGKLGTHATSSIYQGFLFSLTLISLAPALGPAIPPPPCAVWDPCWARWLGEDDGGWEERTRSEGSSDGSGLIRIVVDVVVVGVDELVLVVVVREAENASRLIKVDVRRRFWEVGVDGGCWVEDDEEDGPGWEGWEVGLLREFGEWRKLGSGMKGKGDSSSDNERVVGSAGGEGGVVIVNGRRSDGQWEAIRKGQHED
jgi:hypothetical protein